MRTICWLMLTLLVGAAQLGSGVASDPLQFVWYGSDGLEYLLLDSLGGDDRLLRYRGTARPDAKCGNEGQVVRVTVPRSLGRNLRAEWERTASVIPDEGTSGWLHNSAYDDAVPMRYYSCGAVVGRTARLLCPILADDAPRLSPAARIVAGFITSADRAIAESDGATQALSRTVWVEILESLLTSVDREAALLSKSPNAAGMAVPIGAVLRDAIAEEIVDCGAATVRSGIVEVRRAFVYRAVDLLPPKEAEDALKVALDDADPGVRLGAALNILSSFPSREGKRVDRINSIVEHDYKSPGELVAVRLIKEMLDGGDRFHHQ